MSDSEEEGLERQVKLILVGAPQVGKTALAGRYTNDSFPKQYQVIKNKITKGIYSRKY